MADRETHIRELAKRVEREPGSRFFVPLADEYRKAGRLKDAIATLEGGLVIHGGYVAARVALARAYLEAGRIEDSISAFSRALADDPSNLVAAKALGDLHLSRGEPLEALKRYRRYRGISGDRKLDALIRRLEEETSTAVRPTPEAATPSPPPPPFDAAPAPSPISDLAALSSVQELLARRDRPPAPPPDPHDMSPIFYKRPSGPVPIPSEVAEPPSRDLSLDSLASTRRRDSDGEIITRKIRLPEATWPFETSSSVEPPPSAPPVERAEAEPAPSPPEPSGRTLADLYFQQGHFAEALTIYGELLGANPSDEELRRLHADAERLATPTLPRQLPTPDPARERRLEKVRVLNEWLAVVRASAVAGRDGRLH